MRRTDQPVTDKDSRRHGCCGYCPAAWGEQHADDCVCRKQTVVLQTTIQHVVKVPSFWTPEMIEWHRNKGSWCGDNIVSELELLSQEAEDTGGPCMCYSMLTKYVREATEEDERKRFPL